ncbi:MAG: hypothetical protein ACLGH8_14935 [Bacteroidia bacterium]
MEHLGSGATISHDTIRNWAKARGGKPAVLKDINGNPSDHLHINFLGFAEGDVPISWEEFFAIFDQNDLEFIYCEQTSEGMESRFSKFIKRHN